MRLADWRERADRETAMGLLKNYMFLRKGNVFYRQSKEDNLQLVIPK